MKDDFFLPAIIFVVAVGLIASYMFAVQNGYATSRVIDSDYSEVYRGLLVNSYGATNGLIVANGNVGIGTAGPLSQLSVGGIGAGTVGIYGYKNLTLPGTIESVGIYGSSLHEASGVSDQPWAVGVYGQGTGNNTFVGSKFGIGVKGVGNRYGVFGESSAPSSGIGVYGSSTIGVYGIGSQQGIYGYSNSLGGRGVYGYSVFGPGVYGKATPPNYAGYFDGDVNITGDIISRGTYRYISGPPGAVDDIVAFNIDEYIIEARPAYVGIAMYIPYADIYKLCGDIDGCLVTNAMVNWDAVSRPDNVATRSAMLFLSQTSNWWRWSQFDPVDYEAYNNNGGIPNEIASWDCYFGDFDTSTDSNNGRLDNNLNFGYLNAKGGNFSDTTMTCRLIIKD